MDMNIITIILYFFLVGLNLYYGFSRKNSSLIVKDKGIRIDVGKLFVFALLVLLIIIACTDKNNPDYLSYKNVFKSPMDYDIGYSLIQDVFKNRGIEYHEFRIIVYIFSYMCVWIFINRISINPNIAFALYSIYPFFYDAIQIRNLLAFSIIIIFIPSLFKGKKSGVCLYLVAVIVATTIHKLSLIYVLLLMICIKDKEKKRKLLIFILVVSIVFLSLCKLVPSINTFLFSSFEYLTNDIRVMYTERYSVHLGFILYIFMEALYLLAAYYSSKKSEPELQKNDNVIDYSSIIFEMNLVMSCAFPVFLISAEFYRIFRNISIINYFIPCINMINCDSQINSRKNTRMSNFFFILAFLFNWLYQSNVDGFDRVFWVFFD